MPNARTRAIARLSQLTRLAAAALLGALLILPVGRLQEARAEMDAQAMGQAASALGTTMMMMAVMDSVGSGADCTCMVTGASCPTGVAGFCAMMGLNIAAAIAAMIPVSSGQETAGAVAATGGAGGEEGADGATLPSTFDPNTPLASQFRCPASSPACNCSGPGAASNILCGRGSLQNVKAQLDDIQAKINAGTLDIPEGQTPASLLSSLNNAQSGLDSLLGGKVPGAASGSVGDTLGGGKSSGGGKEGGGLLGGDSFDVAAAMGAGGGKAGPAERTGLGRILLNGGLDAIDEASGKSLSIWQRSSRRYQGDERGGRAFFMAKIESIRSGAAKARAQALARAGELKIGTPAASANDTPTGRAPAAVKPAVRLRHGH